MCERVYHGPLTYASLPWEAVDWNLFEFVGVDYYRDARTRDSYLDMLQPLFATGKPVVVTEMGWGTCRGTGRLRVRMPNRGWAAS